MPKQKTDTLPHLRWVPLTHAFSDSVHNRFESRSLTVISRFLVTALVLPLTSIRPSTLTSGGGGGASLVVCVRARTFIFTCECVSYYDNGFIRTNFFVFY
jgi:hypothetical protein